MLGFFNWFYRERQRGRGRGRRGERERGRGRERNIDMRKKHPFSCLPYTPLPGIEPETWECALTGHRNYNPLVHGNDTPTKWATSVRAILITFHHIFLHYLHFYIFGGSFIRIWANWSISHTDYIQEIWPSESFHIFRREMTEGFPTCLTFM